MLDTQINMMFMLITRYLEGPLSGLQQVKTSVGNSWPEEPDNTRLAFLLRFAGGLWRESRDVVSWSLLTLSSFQEAWS